MNYSCFVYMLSYFHFFLSLMSILIFSDWYSYVCRCSDFSFIRPAHVPYTFWKKICWICDTIFNAIPLWTLSGQLQTCPEIVHADIRHQIDDHMGPVSCKQIKTTLSVWVRAGPIQTRGRLTGYRKGAASVPLFLDAPLQYGWIHMNGRRTWQRPSALAA